MNEMIEHVAYKIAKAEEPNMGLSWCMNPDNRDRCRKLARVAVAALRKPTAAMRHAGAEADQQWGYIEAVFEAMIDAALKD